MNSVSDQSNSLGVYSSAVHGAARGLCLQLDVLGMTQKAGAASLCQLVSV